MATLLITHDLGARRRILRPYRGHACRPYRRDRADRASCSPLRAIPIPRSSSRRRPARRRGSMRSPPIPGSLPDLRRADLPACRYSERCERRGEDCGDAPLPRSVFAAGQRVACRHPLMNGRRNAGQDFRLGTAAARGRRAAQAVPCRAQQGGMARAPPAFLHAVEDVSFTIGPGETVGLVGEFGCGKSTLVRLMTRLIDPTPARSASPARTSARCRPAALGGRRIAAQIQMVFQDATDSLNPRFTAFRAIADPLMRLRRLPRAALRRGSKRSPGWSDCRRNCSTGSAPALGRSEGAGRHRARDRHRAAAADPR